MPRAIRGLQVLTSMAMSTTVLMQETASALPASAARAIWAISGKLGLSLTTRARRVILRTFLVIRSTSYGSVPKAIPPFSTLGQERLSS